MDQLFSLVPSGFMPIIHDTFSHVAGSFTIDAPQVAGYLMMLGIAVAVCFLLFRLLLLIFKLGLLVGALYFLTLFIGVETTDTNSVVIPNQTAHSNTAVGTLSYAQVSPMQASGFHRSPHPGAPANVPALVPASGVDSVLSWELVSDKIGDTMDILKEYEFSIKKRRSY